jgi:hypothetical protein
MKLTALAALLGAALGQGQCSMSTTSATCATANDCHWCALPHEGRGYCTASSTPCPTDSAVAVSAKQGHPALAGGCNLLPNIGPGGPTYVQGRFCGTLADQTSTVPFRPKVRVVFNCAAPGNDQLPASFYGVCNNYAPDHCNSPVLCAGSLSSVTGNIAVLTKDMEKTPGTERCFNPTGVAAFTLTGNHSALKISGYAFGQSSMSGLLVPCVEWTS